MFGKRFAALVAVIAIAPEIAFGRNLSIPQVSSRPTYELLDFNELLRQIHRLAKARQESGNGDTIDIYTDTDSRGVAYLNQL